MSIRCQCTQCGARYNLPDTAAGKKIKCAKCSAVFPATPAAPAPAAPAPEVPSTPSSDMPAINVGGSSVLSRPGHSKSGSVKVSFPGASADTVASSSAFDIDVGSRPKSGVSSKSSISFPAAEPPAPAVANVAPAADTGGFPVAVGGSSGSQPSTSGSHTAYKKKSNPNLVPILIGVGAVVVMTIGGIAYFAMTSDPGEDKTQASSPKKPGKKEKARPRSTESSETTESNPAETAKPSTPAATTGTLVLDWPESARANSQLRIDNAASPVPALGPISLTLKPGPHSIAIQRRGYEPLAIPIRIMAGEEMTAKPEFKEVAAVAFTPPATNIPDNTAETTPTVTPTVPQPMPTPTVATPAPKPYSIGRPRTEFAKADLTTTAEELSKAYSLNELQATKQFGGEKHLQIEGVFQESYPIEGAFGGCVMRLQGAGDNVVDCHIYQHWVSYVNTLRPGHKVTVIGTNPEIYPEDKRLLRISFCEFITDDHRPAGADGEKPADEPMVTGGPPQPGVVLPGELYPRFTFYPDDMITIRTTAEKITGEFAANAEKAGEDYRLGVARIEGTISELKEGKDDAGRDYVTVYLAGAGGLRIECPLCDGWYKYAKTLKVGQKAAVLGSAIMYHADKKSVELFCGEMAVSR